MLEGDPGAAHGVAIRHVLACAGKSSTGRSARDTKKGPLCPEAPLTAIIIVAKLSHGLKGRALLPR